MDTLTTWITSHAQHAHWYIFTAIILAGFNIPVCLDLLVLVGAILAASIVPEHTWHLFISVLLGCYFSAWCAYWVGRLLGQRLQKMRLFSSLLKPEKIDKIAVFYKKYGLLTLIIGRFIPFGVRNGIFMTTGMSKMHFRRFILMDALACCIWCSTYFYGFYFLSQHHDQLWQSLKTVNLLIFIAFSLAVIILIWYKNRKKIRQSNVKSI